MLHTIFEKHTKSQDKAGKETKKGKNEKDLDKFLNEEENLTMKNKCDEAMKKYCTLYDDEDDTQNKYSIKPLNYQFEQHKKRKIENANTTGPGWFNMTAPEMTPELRNDLKAIHLRHVMDPGRFYKKMDSDALPKFFQIGTILDNILDGKKNRLSKKEIKHSIAEEFLEADLAKNYSIRKFEELQDKRRKVGLKKNKLNKYKMQNRKKARRAEYVPK